MSAAEKLWLDSISLDDLERFFLWLSKKRMKIGCSCGYFGVYRISAGECRPWRAKLSRTVDKVARVLWWQDFENPEDAARAWDQAVLHYCGRCAGGCRDSTLSRVPKDPRAAIVIVSCIVAPCLPSVAPLPAVLAY